MKIAYIDKKFQRKSLALLSVVNTIIEDFLAQGYELTLRQLYYQMIAGDHFPDNWIDPEYNAKHGLPPNTKNTEKNYDKFGSLLSDARLAGLVNWDAIVDRGRFLRGLSHWNTPGDVINSAASGYQKDLWKGQTTRVEVWIEKDALSGIVETPCSRWDVPFLACKGYTSQSEMWGAAQRLMGYIDRKGAERVVILHLGDHDPSGIDMSRDIQDRLALFCTHHGFEAPELRRIALNMDQIRQYNPPPNPAKLTDCRAAGYIERFGRDSWELDALSPKVMDDLISEHLNGLVDIEKFNAIKEEQEAERLELKNVAGDYQNIVRNGQEIAALVDILSPHDEGETLADCAKRSIEISDSLRAEKERLQQQLADYQEAHEDKKRLTRELDVIINGGDAAKQASLCDIVGQLSDVLPALRNKADRLEKELADAKRKNKAKGKATKRKRS